MKAKYDNIGINYSQKRKSDPRIASQILSKLEKAKSIVNIGAGSGSYEPDDIELVALEPSIEMINQRSSNAHPTVQGVAESLPFPDNSFTHALTILSMHHWTNREMAYREINRVATEKFVAVSWNPNSEPFWLTKDYFPEIFEYDKRIFPDVNEIENYFDNVQIEPLLIPEDCIDGFLAAYWKKPSAYLDINVRNSISSFSKLNDITKGLKKLKTDIENKSWIQVNKSILSKSSLDAGYVIITGNTKST